MMMRQILRGAAAGAAGSTALNAVTYTDMVLRGRPVSGTPDETMQRIAGRLGVDIPGDRDTRANRVSGLGALSGLLTGVAVGALIGATRGLGLRPGLGLGAALAGGAAMVGANGSMVVLGVTDPRTWSAADWASDVVPHVAYGVVTALVLADADRDRS